MIYLDLIFNLSLLVTLSIVSGFIERHGVSRGRLNELMQGALFGGAAVLGMLRPLDLGSGLIFDGRSIMVSLCALFFGPLAAALAVAMTLLVRIGLGGTGMVMGVLVTLSSAGIGLLARSRSGREAAPPSTGQLYLFGLLVHAAMVVLMFTLPRELWETVIRRIGPPVLLMYPLATILAGKILSDQVSAARMMAALERAKQDLAVTLHSIGDAVISTDPEGRIALMNPVAEALTGWSRDDARGKPMGEVFRVAGEEKRENAGRGVLLPREGDGKGRYITYSAAPIREPQGEVRGMVLVFQDRTEERRAEEKLRESESRYRTLFDRGADGILILDPDTATPTVFNDQVCGQLGYTREEFARLSISDIDAIENGATTRARIQRILETGYDEFETLHRTRDGAIRNVYVKAQYIEGEGKPLYHCIWRDITDSKQAEEEKEKLRKQLQTAQKMEAVGTLAGGIAHDFNNALTGIFGFGSLLRERMAGDAEAGRDLDDLLNCAERAAKLTRQLLTFARRQVIEPANVDLDALVSGLMSLIRRVVGEQIEIDCRLEGAPTVLVDRGQVEQVLMNLCLNARDAMPEGGKLFVSTGSALLDEEFVARNPYMRVGKYALLEVADTGVGMDEKTRERVFDPFFTTKEPDKGTGLGLAVVYGIVKQHNGFLHLFSEPGKGTTFKVYFPAVDAAPDAVSEKSSEEALRGGTETVLLADDEEPVRAIACRILKELGYDVLVARDGEEAVEIFRRSPKVDLAVLDLVMPAKGGREAFREMRGETPGLKAIFMSGYSHEAVHESFALTEGQPFLQKPFAPTMLARKIRETLDAEGSGHAG